MQPVFTGVADAPAAPCVAVVVDVMRAFTVAAWAFRRGAERIVFAGTLEEALELKARHPGWLAVQDGEPVPGFDLANSPGRLRSHDLRGRTLVQKTTAGTVGALAVARARLLLCASFVVAGATAEVLRRARPETVAFVVTGDGGRAEEDLACAQYIAERARAGGARPDPGPYLDRARRSHAAARLSDGVRRGLRGVHAEDVAMCLEADAFPFAMTAIREDGRLVLRPVEPGGPPSPPPA
ncbi:putative 2-phosphosulfolactate phosphatase [Streptomyces lucensis JCM 4490]|uniref:Probable 2-phosphosulfolactate phosphatase n=1 Tax=Streptomyces lucensis JCM 4490 TaxID=1306176 RepID=A0A918JBB6_9ACTN|nr:2-phosphosulfolactate phosphatase [Streptomyces lucensis]GGW71295.1 putative 2-phosphosulfolactate phosphatase [Streptomyces lucensis JCM 4490]